MRELRLDDSSNVCRLKWTNDDKLEVEFNTGSIYVYSNVQKHQFSDAAGSDSVGAWVQRVVVKNPTAYPFVKVRSSEEANLDAARERLDAQLKATVQANVDAMREALEQIADAHVERPNIEAIRKMQLLARVALGRKA